MRASWRDIKNRTMTKRQQTRAQALAMQDLRKMELRDLREALQITQVTLARKLKTTQAAVSRLEKRPGMMVNTLGDYIEALGGKIEVHAVLPDRTVNLTQFFRKKPMDPRIKKKTTTRRTGRSRVVARA
jgi:chemotaxis methyl-accepting protein methylase